MVEYYRAHDPAECGEFAAANAVHTGDLVGVCSRCQPVAGDFSSGQECEHGSGLAALGYSCCDSSEELVEYMTAQGMHDDMTDCPVVVFSGRLVGRGVDGEPLVVPDGHVVRWTVYGDL